MRKPNLLLVHDTSAPPLSLDHLQAREGEPRIRDMDLAECLGFATGRERNIRLLIERNLPELRIYGEVRFAVKQTSDAGGRPGRECWLNEGQALVLCALSRTPQAAAVRKQVITVFMAYRSGTLGAPAAPDLTDRLASLGQSLAALREELRVLNVAAQPPRGRQPRIEAPRAPAQPAAPIPSDASGGNLLYGIRAIADHLGVHPRQAKHRTRTGQIPSFKLGRSVCATRTSLNAWLAKRMPAAGVRS